MTVDTAPPAPVLAPPPPDAAPTRSRPAGRGPLRLAGRALLLVLVAVVMLVPLYLLVLNAFKDQQAILAEPFGVSGGLTVSHLVDAMANPRFNIAKGYAITVLFVVLVNAFSVFLTGPAAYVIARSTKRRFRVLMLFFLAGTFIPSQVLVIPVVYVLKTVGLMGTIPGYVLFETTLTLPFSIFLYAGYIRTVPTDLDQAAALDGCGRYRTFWQVVFPLMRPVVATMVILNTFSVWNDFVNPQTILGPSSGLYTVTTGIYAAVGQYQTDYTVVFPTLLLAIAPLLMFFVIMQRHIISGLTAGSTKG